MNRTRWILLIVAALLHAVLFLNVRLNTDAAGEEAERAEVVKLVDAREEVPPAEEEIEEEEPEPPPEDTVEVTDEPAQEYQETEQEVEKVERLPPSEPDYLPQHRISQVPEIPTSEIQSRIEYPQMARRQGLEGTVFLELLIDEYGKIRKIEVLRDPGFGFAEAATAALEGITVRPAEANGVPVAVRYRYPVRFQLR